MVSNHGCIVPLLQGTYSFEGTDPPRFLGYSCKCQPESGKTTHIPSQGADIQLPSWLSRFKIQTSIWLVQILAWLTSTFFQVRRRNTLHVQELRRELQPHMSRLQAAAEAFQRTQVAFFWGLKCPNQFEAVPRCRWFIDQRFRIVFIGMHLMHLSETMGKFFTLFICRFVHHAPLICDLMWSPSAMVELGTLEALMSSETTAAPCLDCWTPGNSGLGSEETVRP